MKNRIFSLMAIILFMSSATNTYAAQLSDCEIMAVNIHNMMLDAGINHFDAYIQSGMIEQLCEEANTN